MATTNENLQAAFAGESMAHLKYLAFARQAEKEGLPNIASLFRATAQAELLHAHGHLNAMDGVHGTLENLEKAIAGENYEHQEMYPPMYEQAASENHPAKKMFKWAMEVEKVHSDCYQRAMTALKAGKDLDLAVYLCPVCGHLEFAHPPVKCPVCGVPGAKYQKIE